MLFGYDYWCFYGLFFEVTCDVGVGYKCVLRCGKNMYNCF